MAETHIDSSKANHQDKCQSCIRHTNTDTYMHTCAHTNRLWIICRTHHCSVEAEFCFRCDRKYGKSKNIIMEHSYSSKTTEKIGAGTPLFKRLRWWCSNDFIFHQPHISWNKANNRRFPGFPEKNRPFRELGEPHIHQTLPGCRLNFCKGSAAWIQRDHWNRELKTGQNT